MVQRRLSLLSCFLIISLLALAGPVSAATITIDTTTPGGIAGAVGSATAGDTIILNPGTYIENGITIDKNIRIQANTSYGGTAADTIIDGKSALPGIFAVNGAVTFTMDNLTLQNGVASNGGAIDTIGGTLTITSSKFSNCTATGGGWGGAIYALGGSISITATTFSDCSADTGGAIYAQIPSLTVTSSTFSDCSATDGGGAIMFSSVTTATISTSNFFRCSANRGGALYLFGTTLTLTSSTISDCWATWGGGIIMFSSTVNISSSSFIFCIATSDGGVIYQESGTLTISYSAFSYNHASAYGGAIYLNDDTLTISTTTFSHCTAGGSGGATYTKSTSDITISSSAFSDCSALQAGAVDSSGTTSISNSTFTSCQALDYSGGAIASGDGTLTIASSTFTNCSARSNGGAIRSDGSTTRTITSSSFYDCSASSGGAIYSYNSPVTVRFSQIVNSGYTALFNVTGSVTARYNWWGTNPGSIGYTNAGENAVPWLILNETATPSTINSTRTSVIRANLTFDSAGTDTSGSGHIQNGTAITFSIANGAGSLSTLSNTTTFGAAETTFTPSGAGIIVINASVDGYPVSVPVTVTGPTFTGTPVDGTAPLTVGFTDASVGFPTRWNWSFGDGQWFNTTNAAEKSPAHTYTSAGTYTVSLTVTVGGVPDTLSRTGYITVRCPSSTPAHTPTTSPPAANPNGGDSPPAQSQQDITMETNVGGNSAVQNVAVTGTGLNGIVVTGTVQAGPGEGVPPAPGTSYQYIELEPAQYSSINGATITFTVPVAWIEENGLSPQDIVLYHYTGTGWEALPTTPDTGSNGMVTFTAVTSGFSLYAIGGREDAGSVAAQQVKTFGNLIADSGPAMEPEVPVITQTTAAPAPAPVPETGNPAPFIIAVAGLVILAAGGFVARRWWIRRQN